MTEVRPEEDVPFGYVRLDDGSIVSKDELCPGCGGVIGDTDFCPSCGEPL